MPSISYNGQSFSIDNRRLWLVSGAIHYPRVPRGLWRDRIRAAKQAGLNCIETYVFWNAHEPEPGRFDFSGNLDLRAFVETIRDEGMFAIVRPGPYICAEWDMGGMPPWLHRTGGGPKQEPMRMRQMNGPFMEASSRYLRNVMDQIRDLQVTTPREGRKAPMSVGNHPGEAAGGFHASLASQCGGPILLMQAENEWFSHNPEKGHDYLREIVRYLRESGAEVPITVCNQLWQEVEGTLHTWNGARNLPADLRQLGVVQPDSPRLVSEYWPGWFDHWGGKHSEHVDAQRNMYRLNGILAAGGQYNLYMFHGGTNFRFWGGRTIGGKDCYTTTSYDYDAPLLEAGGRSDKYALTKRISMFASQFSSVLAHLEIENAPAIADPNEAEHPISVMHLRGSQGHAVFLNRAQGDKTSKLNVLLPNGLSLPVDMGDDRAAWLLFDAKLAGACRIDFTNLRPWAFLERKLLVLFGPAGSAGIVSLDDEEVHLTVPSGQEPAVERLENLTLLVLSDAQVDQAYHNQAGVVLGAAKLDDRGQAVPARGVNKLITVDLDGQISRQTVNPPRKPRAPQLTGWAAAKIEPLIDGSSEDYNPVDGPASLEELGCDFGYGWYKIALPENAASGSNRLLAPGGGDRLSVYQDSKLKGVLGTAADDEPADLKLAGDVTVLADNLGRFNFAQHLGHDVKGIPHDLVQVKTIRLPKPTIQDEQAPDPFALTEMVYHRQKGVPGPAQSLMWSIKPESRRPLILDIQNLDAQGVILVNDQPVGLYHGAMHGKFQRLWLDPGDDGPLTGGKNEIKLALYGPVPEKLNANQSVNIYQVTNVITSRAQWYFARWRQPRAEQFTATAPQQKLGRPVWYQANFNISSTDAPLFFDARGLSKGQLFLNGHNIGRYFIADEKGKAKGPQKNYYLPEPWLHTNEPNQLTIFEENGHPPTKCKLAYLELGPYGKS